MKYYQQSYSTQPLFLEQNKTIQQNYWKNRITIYGLSHLLGTTTCSTWKAFWLIHTREWVTQHYHTLFCMSLVTAMQAAVIGWCRWFRSHIFSEYTKLSRWHHKRKSKAQKSGDLSGHSCHPLLPTQWPRNCWPNNLHTGKWKMIMQYSAVPSKYHPLSYVIPLVYAVWVNWACSWWQMAAVWLMKRHLLLVNCKV